jgi:hypothetical protein
VKIGTVLLGAGAVVGAYLGWQWWKKTRGTPFAGGAHTGGLAPGSSGSVADAAGQPSFPGGSTQPAVDREQGETLRPDAAMPYGAYSVGLESRLQYMRQGGE